MRVEDVEISGYSEYWKEIGHLRETLLTVIFIWVVSFSKLFKDNWLLNPWDMVLKNFVLNKILYQFFYDATEIL
jgi:hypothetical protein